MPTLRGPILMPVRPPLHRQAFDGAAADRHAGAELRRSSFPGLLPQPGGFEGVGTMAEQLDLPHPSIPDRPELEEVDDYRNAALPASATSAVETQYTSIRDLLDF